MTGFIGPVTSRVPNWDGRRVGFFNLSWLVMEKLGGDGWGENSPYTSSRASSGSV